MARGDTYIGAGGGGEGRGAGGGERTGKPHPWDRGEAGRGRGRRRHPERAGPCLGTTHPGESLAGKLGALPPPSPLGPAFLGAWRQEARALGEDRRLHCGRSAAPQSERPGPGGLSPQSRCERPGRAASVAGPDSRSGGQRSTAETRRMDRGRRDPYSRKRFGRALTEQLVESFGGRVPRFDRGGRREEVRPW